MKSTWRMIGLVAALAFLSTAARSTALGAEDAPPAETPAAEAPAEEPQPAEPAEEKPVIRVSEETTRITEPLKANGLVDYVAAVNNKLREGVTPENNAMVLYVRAFGPAEIDVAARGAFFEKLGIEPLPVTGEYLLGIHEYLAELPAGEEAPTEERMYADRDEAMQQPWSAMDKPHLARWLEKNEKPLALVVEGTKRPRCYTPLVGDSLIATLLPTLGPIREAAWQLTTRAMLRVSQGEFEAAYDDLVAVDRLAEHASSGPTLIDMLVGIATDAMAQKCWVAFLQNEKLPEPLLARSLEHFAARAPQPRFTEKIEPMERYMYLDAVQGIATEEMDLSVIGGGLEGILPRVRSFIDWNETLKQGNEMYDKLLAAARIADPVERKAAEEAFFEEVQKMAEPPGILEMARLVLDPDRSKKIGRRMGGVFNALLLPAFSAVDRAEFRGVAGDELVQLTGLLEQYRRKHESYPETLAALAEAFPAAPLKHSRDGGEYQYRRTEGGYTLWRLGSDPAAAVSDAGDAMEFAADNMVIVRRNR